MALFIDLQIDLEKCLGIMACGKCLKVCPVQIFEPKSGKPATVDANLDECTLCNLCLQECEPNALTVCKLYE